MSAGGSAVARKSIRVGVVTPIVGLNPYDLQDYASGVVAHQVFEPPYIQDDVHGPARNRVLERPEVTSGDLCTVRARLVPGVCFSDGSPVRAADVADSLRRSPKAGSVESVEALGDAVEIRLRQAEPRLDVTLSKRWCAITREQPDGTFLGTGPYFVDTGSKPTHVVLRRSPQASPPPAIETVEFVAYPPDGEGRFTALASALESGEVDFTFVLNRDTAKHLSGVRKLFQPGSSTLFLYMNTERAPFDSAEFRRAVSIGVDRYELASVTYDNPAGFVASSALPPRFSRFRDGIVHDPIAAKERLRALDPPGGPLRTLMIWGPRPYVSNPQALGKRLARQFAAIGLETDIVHPKGHADYFDMVRRGDYDIVIGGWIADTSDPADFLESILGSSCIPTTDVSRAATSNQSRWSDPVTDAAIASLRRTGDSTSIDAVLERVRDEVPLLPLSYGPTCAVHQWRIQGFELDPLGLPNFAAMDVD